MKQYWFRLSLHQSVDGRIARDARVPEGQTRQANRRGRSAAPAVIRWQNPKPELSVEGFSRHDGLEALLGVSSPSPTASSASVKFISPVWWLAENHLQFKCCSGPAHCTCEPYAVTSAQAAKV